MQAAAGEQAPGILFYVVRNELVYAGSEADDLGSYVVDQHRPIDPGFIEVLQKGFGGAAELGNFVVVRALLLHQFEGLRLEHFQRLNVDVAVCDQVVVGLSLVVGDRSILFVDGLKDGPLSKDADHLSSILRRKRRGGQRLCGSRG